MKINRLLFLILFIGIVFSCSDDDKNYVPSEILGTWEAENGVGCYETFIFSSNSLNWLQYCPLTGGRDDITYEFVKDNTTYNALGTNRGYWYVYHVISSTKIVVARYDEDTDLGTIGDWWEIRGITLTKS